MSGITVPKPDGAFYLFPRVDGLEDSFGFCRRLLEETRVGLAPEWPSAPEAKDRCAFAMPRSAPSWNRPWSGWLNFYAPALEAGAR